MVQRLGTQWLLFSLAASPALAQGVAIEHGAVACVMAGQFPRIEARIGPGDRVARARTFFHADDDARWYYVDMKPEDGVFHGVLPRPMKATKRIHYYVEATDKSMAQNRTEEYAPEVVSDASACSKKGAVAAVAVASKVVVGAPAGAPAVPAGFAAAAAGGIGTTAVVVGGIVVAGGAGAAVALKQATQNDDIVAGYAIEGFAIRSFTPRVTAQGAVVSSSLDSVTTTTDAQGRFTLVPSTPCHTKSQPRGDVGGVVFTVTIAAAGCDTSSHTKQWGCAKPGQFQPQDFNLNLNTVAPNQQANLGCR